MFTGLPESMKSLVAAALGLEFVREGGALLLVDLEMGPRDTLIRLREMGATDDDLDRVIYCAPDTPATPDTLVELVDRYNIGLAVFDAAAGIYRLHGLSDNRREDVEKLADLLIGPCRDRGVSTIIIDHVVKNAADRGDWAIGSERKLGSADVALGFVVEKPLRRGADGLVRIRTNKDRNGHLSRPYAAEVAFRSDPETHALTWEFRACEQSDVDPESFRPTVLMERVSVFLETQSQPVSRREIERHVKGKTEHIRKAIEVLVREGHAIETDGEHRPLRSARPFRSAEDGATWHRRNADRWKRQRRRERGGQDDVDGGRGGRGAPPVPLPPTGGHGGAPAEAGDAAPPDDRETPPPPPGIVRSAVKAVLLAEAQAFVDAGRAQWVDTSTPRRPGALR